MRNIDIWFKLNFPSNSKLRGRSNFIFAYTYDRETGFENLRGRIQKIFIALISK